MLCNVLLKLKSLVQLYCELFRSGPCTREGDVAVHRRHIGTTREGSGGFLDLPSLPQLYDFPARQQLAT